MLIHNVSYIHLYPSSGFRGPDDNLSHLQQQDESADFLQQGEEGVAEMEEDGRRMEKEDTGRGTENEVVIFEDSVGGTGGVEDIVACLLPCLHLSPALSSLDFTACLLSAVVGCHAELGLVHTQSKNINI